MSGDQAREPGGEEQNDERCRGDPRETTTQRRSGLGTQCPGAIRDLCGDEEGDEPAERMDGERGREVAVGQVDETACESTAGAIDPEQDFALADFGERPLRNETHCDALVRADVQEKRGDEDADGEAQDEPMIFGEVVRAR